MKRITCSLCGGTGFAYEGQDPVEAKTDKPVVAALERNYQLSLPMTDEEEEAWKHLEKQTVNIQN